MLVRVKVKTGVRKESFAVVNETNFSIAVKEAPERNLVNKRLKELLAEYFEVTSGAVRLMSGHHAPQKIFDVRVD